jgi:hypothetical protein
MIFVEIFQKVMIYEYLDVSFHNFIVPYQQHQYENVWASQNFLIICVPEMVLADIVTSVICN